MNFEQGVLKFIKKNKLISSRGLVLLGVSGGADSMALLVAFARLRHELGIQLHAMHFNHRFRPQARHDELFVSQWCKKLNVPLNIGRRQGGVIKHLSEDDARKMRFDFFIKTANRLHAQSVALAHTRNDLAETVLMRLMRGCGLYGLRAIFPQRSIDGVSFVRPLLEVNRLDVENYLRLKKTPFCTDATNRSTVYERNKIRLKLLPLLAKEYNPQIMNALSDLAITAGDDYDYLSLQAQKAFEGKVILSFRKGRLELKGIGRQHPSILRLILRKMVEGITVNKVVLSFEHIQALENLLAQSSLGAVDLPEGLRALKTSRFLEIYYA